MKLEDIVLKKGDRITLRKSIVKEYYVIDALNNIRIGDYYNPEAIEKIAKIERPVQYETIYEAPQRILDKEEKEYLENFLRPFKNWDVRFLKAQSLNDGEYLLIQIGIVSIIKLPPFKKGTMYKGMELDKEYTLKELGLFE